MYDPTSPAPLATFADEVKGDLSTVRPARGDVPDELPWLRELLESGLIIEQVFAELDKNVDPEPPEAQ